MIMMLMMIMIKMIIMIIKIMILMLNCIQGGEKSNYERRSRDDTGTRDTTRDSTREFISGIFKERVLRDFWMITQQEEEFLRKRQNSSDSECKFISWSMFHLMSSFILGGADGCCQQIKGISPQHTYSFLSNSHFSLKQKS